jgi:hypothetical protein
VRRPPSTRSRRPATPTPRCAPTSVTEVDYRLYFDEMQFLGQLGLLPEEQP